MQVAPQQTRSSIVAGVHETDLPQSSRRQFPQHSPQSVEQTRKSSGNRSNNSPSSSRRPSRRPSANAPQSNADSSPINQYQLPSSPYSSNTTTSRAQEMVPGTYASPVGTVQTTSSAHQRQRRDQRGQREDAGGPPIPPPPRTSSHRAERAAGDFPDFPLTDRTMQAHYSARTNEEGASSSHAPGQYQITRRDNKEYANPGEEHGRSEQARPNDAPSAAAAAATARSRRRGPTSPEGPQRATSSREPKSQTPPTAIQSRSASHASVSTPPLRNTRDDEHILTRMVVTDPVVDIAREQERLAEAVPGSAATGSPEVDDGGRKSPQRRRDYSSSAASSKRKETNFGEYILGKTLGEGEFGKVKLGWKRDGSVQVAIKLIRREALGTNPSRLPKIYREISILQGLSHPNIVRLHEMAETEKHIGIVLEYASGGELFDFILNHRYLKDAAARKLFAQLISGVGYLHKKGIVHRDLKLENLLLDRHRNIIITDFGFANTFDPLDQLDEEIEYKLTDRDFVRRKGLDQIQENGKRKGDLMQTSCGSPCYAAPELVVTDSLYTGRKVDVWSCGVILYAMLAGYLPFDDDPANPEGDNINLLYKYITSTPLTFPEYVTPHARDLLRRILVPDPRKRADLFEVARHSWLSDFAHIVSHVTSSTTTISEIANTTVASDQQEAPLLARSASVREPTKTQPPNMSPIGGLTHSGKMDPDQAAEKAKGSRDPKRRTVQVEYVAPQSQTARGEVASSVQSPAIPSSPAAIANAPSKTRARSGSQGQETSQRQTRGAPLGTRPLPRDSYTVPDMRPNQTNQASQSNGAGRAQQRPTTSQQPTAPPVKPYKDALHSTSEGPKTFASVPVSAVPRPNTGGSMASNTTGRLPSRGNSYSQPLAPTVAVTNAQGRLAQPKNGKQYSISAPIPQQEPYIQEPSIGRPSTQAYSTAPPLPSQREARGHKRSNTLGNVFGRTGSFFGGRSQQAQEQEKPEKRYPPTSMRAPIASDSPRQSVDSRRSTSFGFGRKSSDLKKTSDPSRPEKPRRFSLLPASFSFRSLTGGSKDSSTENILPVSERRQSSTLQQAPPSRGQPLTGGYGRGSNREHSYRTEDGGQAVFDGSRDRARESVAQQSQKSHIPHSQSTKSGYQPQSELQAPPRIGQSYLLAEGTPTESEISLGMNQNRPLYPLGFNSYDEEHGRPSMQQGRSGRGVLTKNNRRFADVYDQEAEPGAGTGGHHAGSSGPAKRVMDFFRRRGKARAGDDRV
ncbi:MAG: hypothetical protein LQ351_001135 [Letrouitia transgressa]|nr:MAG: hypothetical protein LQ351_001135 [Letrouitia transgressa]